MGQRHRPRPPKRVCRRELLRVDLNRYKDPDIPELLHQAVLRNGRPPCDGQ